MNGSIVSLVLVSLVARHVHASLTLSFTDCGENQVTALRSSTCATDPCRVPLGGNASIEVDFVPKIDAQKVKILVFASVFGFELSLPLDDDDACAAGRLSCPIRAGVAQSLRYDLQIKDSYYPVSGDVGFRLLTEDNEAIACATISAEIYAKETEGEVLEDHQEL